MAATSEAHEIGLSPKVPPEAMDWHKVNVVFSKTPPGKKW
jgi:hypothetical protein